jgi:hypothetical protein
MSSSGNPQLTPLHLCCTSTLVHPPVQLRSSCSGNHQLFLPQSHHNLAARPAHPRPRRGTDGRGSDARIRDGRQTSLKQSSPMRRFLATKRRFESVTVPSGYQPIISDITDRVITDAQVPRDEAALRVLHLRHH